MFVRCVVQLGKPVHNTFIEKKNAFYILMYVTHNYLIVDHQNIKYNIIMLYN